MKDLYVLDASGFLYRSYFAIRNMTNAKGESTNALFGFIRSVLKLYKDFHPKHIISVFDGPNNCQTRTAIYADYKAHRAETPADLIEQLKWAQQACELLGIPYLSIPGVEADDTMGSIAFWAKEQGAKVYLCTSDKDMCQLVDEQIVILNTHKENQILDIRGVEEAHGVLPTQMIDYLALIGDSSDNIPGVAGFGPKTASTLLKQFGSLDQILRNIHMIPGKKQEMLVKGADSARMSRELVKIDTQVPFPKDSTFFELHQPNREELKEFYTRMDFKSLLREMDAILTSPTETPTAAPSKETETTYTLVDEESAFEKLLTRLATHKEICLTSKLSASYPLKSSWMGIGFAVAEGAAWYVPANGHLGLGRVVAGLKKLFQNPNIHFFGHNIKCDYLILANQGIQLERIDFDVMLASYLLNSHKRQHTLEDLMLDHFGKTKLSLSAHQGKGKESLSSTNEIVKTYFCEEADYTFRLKKLLQKQLEERHLLPLLMDLELPLTTILAKMEQAGIYIDLPKLSALSKTLMHQIAQLEQEIYELAGEEFNINSSKQLGEILFTKMGITPPKKTATGLSTNADVLESLKDAHPLAGKILTYRTLEKLRSTYVDTLPGEVDEKTHRIHCTFNQCVAATGRLSCQDPNLQNIPIRTEMGRNIREAFRPEKTGWSYLSADYSQIELRLLAHFSGDPHLIEAFKNGDDIHRRTAAHIYGVPLEQVTREQRSSAKTVNFGVLYGQGAFGLSQELGISNKEAAEFIEMYFRLYPNVKEYLESCKEKTRLTGKSTTYTGRERSIPEIHSKNGQIRAAAERFAINTPIQGTAADLIKLAMIKIDEKLNFQKIEGFMILQIHDELIFELPDHEISSVEHLVRDAMEGIFQLNIPLTVDITIGKNWKEC